MADIRKSILDAEAKAREDAAEAKRKEEVEKAKKASNDVKSKSTPVNSKSEPKENLRAELEAVWDQMAS